MSENLVVSWLLDAAIIVAVAALGSAVLILALHPLLVRYALAQPNFRSSHKIPTPQGGGIAVIAATLAVAFAACAMSAMGATTSPLPELGAAVVLMAGTGAAADVHPVGVAPRLLLQTLAVAIVVHTLPGELRVAPFLPWWVERALLVLAGVWFVNLVNFMDGLDWMTVAEVVPITAALAVIGMRGALPPPATIVALALCGAMIGFAWFNRPVAKLFLGDVGSLPIGLTLGWLLVELAGNGRLAAAILLPLYYLGDSTITILRRWRNGERIWQAHRSHFYQRATDRGFTVLDVVTRVFAANIVLAALALMTVLLPSAVAAIAGLVAGGIVTGFLLMTLARGRA